jgi:putrescine carbamoyltransferase
MTQHFADTQDFSKSTLLEIIELIRRLKEADKAGACRPLLKCASLGMIFEEPSTRTRVSLDVAMANQVLQAIEIDGEIFS